MYDMYPHTRIETVENIFKSILYNNRYNNCLNLHYLFKLNNIIYIIY